MTVACFIYRNIYARYQAPGECIISDQGGEFNNHVMQSLSESYDVDFRICNPGNPKSNSIAEAGVKKIKNKMRAFMSEKSN